MIEIKIAIEIILVLFFPFLFLGMINRVKSFWAGRRGPSIFQPFFDFIRLLKKGTVISTVSSFPFALAPSIGLAVVIFASLFVPLGFTRGILSFEGDFVLFAYILALGRFFVVVGAMDTGSSFEGMGASREAVFGGLAEPGFFLLLGTFAAFSGVFSFEKALSLPWTLPNGGLTFLVILLSCGALFLLLLTEGCRVPVDDPNTHLELTMIHEVMALDNSGPDLAMINYSAGLKMVLFASLIAALIIPHGILWPVRLSLFILVEILIAVLTGCIESLMARLKMAHVPQLVLVITSFALIVLAVISFFKTGGIQ